MFNLKKQLTSGLSVSFASVLLILTAACTKPANPTVKKIKAGESKEKIVALENLPGFEDYHLPLPNRLGGNLGVAYDELTNPS